MIAGENETPSGKIQPAQFIFGIMSRHPGLDDGLGIRAMGQGQIQAGKQLVHRSRSPQPPRLQQQQVIRQPRHLVTSMAHVEHGNGQLPVQGLQPGQDLRLACLIQGCQGLVQQQQGGIYRQSPGNGHPLLLAAGQMVRLPVQQAFQAQQLHCPVQGRPAAILWQTAQAVFDIAPHVQVGKQAGLLEHVTQGTAMRRQEDLLVLPQSMAYLQMAPGLRLQAGNGPQQGGLATARRAEQGGNAPRRQVEVHVQRKARTPQEEAPFNRHGRATAKRRFSPYTASSNRKENSSRPPDIQWARPYSRAST